MNKVNFMEGDVVYLKSGSPAFTVQESENGDVWVTYYQNDEVKRDRFKAGQLTTEDPNAVDFGI